ncbi:MAG: hypothetical protein GY950_03035 [bacterium]|nr:hypothetical protein [bacterium]
MKHKHSKKLVLSKTTISNLNSKEMTAINGGLTYTDPRACKTKGACSIAYTEAYTCEAGCPACGTAVAPPPAVD